MAKYINKYRLANISPRQFHKDSFTHCFSAEIINETDKSITIKVNSVLDGKDYNKFDKEYELSIDEFSKIQSSLIKL